MGQARPSGCACSTEVEIPNLEDINKLASAMRLVPRQAKVWPPLATEFTPMTAEEAIEADLFNDVDKAEKAIAYHQRRAEGLQRRWWA